MTQDAVPADERLVEHLVHALTSGAHGPGTPAKGAVAVAYARLPRRTAASSSAIPDSLIIPMRDASRAVRTYRGLALRTFFCSDVCAAYRRDLFEQLGGFESPVIFNEDMFFAAHAVQEGYKVAYAADAEVVHSHNYSVKQQFHRNFDLAVSQTAHPEIFEQVSSEAEGMRLVKNTMGYLCKIHKPYLIWKLGWQCVGRYAGYFLGKRYQKLGRRQILKCTMSPYYWKRIWSEK